MTPKPPNPQAFMRSLKDRAANTSKNTGVPTGELIERYYHRRLLARVFHTDREGWVLKGGQALLVRWSQARYSTDVDLLRTGDDVTVDNAVDALIAAASTHMDDHLQLSHYDTSNETAANRPSRKVRFKVMFGLRELSTVSVDVIAAAVHPVGKLAIEQLEAPFAIDSSPWPQIRMWPLEDHVADKISAMYELHREQMLPVDQVQGPRRSGADCTQIRTERRTHACRAARRGSPPPNRRHTTCPPADVHGARPLMGSRLSRPSHQDPRTACRLPHPRRRHTVGQRVHHTTAPRTGNHRNLEV